MLSSKWIISYLESCFDHQVSTHCALGTFLPSTSTSFLTHTWVLLEVPGWKVWAALVSPVCRAGCSKSGRSYCPSARSAPSAWERSHMTSFNHSTTWELNYTWRHSIIYPHGSWTTGDVIHSFNHTGVKLHMMLFTTDQWTTNTSSSLTTDRWTTNTWRDVHPTQLINIYLIFTQFNYNPMMSFTSERWTTNPWHHSPPTTWLQNRDVFLLLTINYKPMTQSLQTPWLQTHNIINDSFNACVWSRK